MQYTVYSVYACGGVCVNVFSSIKCASLHMCALLHRVVGACACELNGKQAMMSCKNAGNMHALYVGGHGKKDMQTERQHMATEQ